MEWIRFGVFFLGIILFIGIAEKVRIQFHWSPEVTRKMVHISTGILIFFSPYLFNSNKPLIWMAIIFMTVNFIGVKSGKLKGMHGTNRKTYGTVFYPLTFLVLILTCWKNHKAVLILSMLILAISDAAAAIVGENLKTVHEYYLGRDKKTLEGTGIMFLTSFLIILFLLPLVDTLDGKEISFSTAMWIGIITACMVTTMEALSSRGSDNLTAPLCGAFVISHMVNSSVAASIQLTIGIGLGLLTGILSIVFHFLSISGSVGTFLLATLIYGIGGWRWTIPIFTFFILSSLLSKIGKSVKKDFKLIFEKSSKRDIGQVLANGFMAGITVLGNHYFPNPIWFVLFLAAIAAVNSDTWATELGIFSKIDPLSIKNFKTVTPGTSGGITPLGTFSGFVGAFIIGLCGWLVTPHTLPLDPFSSLFWIVVVSGFLACMADSLLGATIQAQYQCPVCFKNTERQVHCKQQKTKLISGFRWINNDMVNLVSSAGSIGFVLIFSYLRIF